MNKTIKKEIIKQLRDKKPPAEWQRLITRYLDENEGSDKAIIIRCRYLNGRGFWRTMRELEKQSIYLSQTVFYNRLEEALGEIALRAAYERLICPYCLGGGEDVK